jgi:Tol biopolymer transport system component
MGITQAGRVSRVDWTDQGAQAAAQAGLLPEAQSANGRWLVDTGTASPDGAWVAYTSISYENGGPIFLQETTTGAWSNLTEAMNRARPQDSPALPQTYGWDVIGWFPDSRRLLVGPVDLSIVFVVERESGAFQAIPFDGGGRGGRAFVHLAPDGTRFLFVADDASGAQVLNFYDLASGTVTPVATLSYEEGFLANPRFAPDSSGVAYVVQRGAPGGAADTLELMPLDGGPARTLAKGSLWMAVPIWSPDAQTLAFARAAPSPAAAVPAAENQTQAVLPEMVQSDIWVVTVADGLLSQVTMADGIERSPVWSPDSSSLAYVTGLGEVQMVSLADPSAVAQVTGPAPEAPELTSMFFLP